MSMIKSKWPGRFEIATIAVDPSKGKEGRRGDYSAIVFCGLSGGRFWIDSSIARRPPSLIVSDAIDMAIEATSSGGTLNAFGIETNQFQHLLVGEFERQTNDRGLQPLPIFEIENTVNKKLRISRVGPLLAQRRLVFIDNPSNRLLINQCESFSMKDVSGVHDDGPNALEMAIRLNLHCQGIDVSDDGMGYSL